jgi:hypothetical protein
VERLFLMTQRQREKSRRKEKKRGKKSKGL